MSLLPAHDHHAGKAAVPTQYLVHCTIMHPSLTALFCPTCRSGPMGPQSCTEMLLRLLQAELLPPAGAAGRSVCPETCPQTLLSAWSTAALLGPNRLCQTPADMAAAGLAGARQKSPAPHLRPWTCWMLLRSLHWARPAGLSRHDRSSSCNLSDGTRQLVIWWCSSETHGSATRAPIGPSWHSGMAGFKQFETRCDSFALYHCVCCSVLSCILHQSAGA
jgi:hypothetical protein